MQHLHWTDSVQQDGVSYNITMHVEYIAQDSTSRLKEAIMSGHNSVIAQERIFSYHYALL